MVHADARRIPLADGSVQCCVTSPPYWGLRKYAGEQELIWGGVNDCEHTWQTTTTTITNHNGMTASPSFTGGRGLSARGGGGGTLVIGTCIECGAWRGAYGLEPTIEMYVAHTVEILREVRRVLRADGVCFWNLGDSYCGSWGNFGARDGKQRTVRKERFARDAWENHGGKPPMANAQAGLKPKDLCLIPFRVALAAQADGWWVRSMIVWAKPNPMPESVTDRPTDAYEHIIMLTKSERYYWDQEAVREQKAESTITDSRSNSDGHRRERGYPGAQSNGGTNLGWPEGGRNIRNVWTFATQPYSGAHFATFPEELPRRCILAASKVGDLVLDPFGGSGTTGRVAIELRRRAILLDLAYGADYAPLAAKRTVNVQLEAFA